MEGAPKRRLGGVATGRVNLSPLEREEEFEVEPCFVTGVEDDDDMVDGC